MRLKEVLEEAVGVIQEKFIGENVVQGSETFIVKNKEVATERLINDSANNRSLQAASSCQFVHYANSRVIYAPSSANLLRHEIR